MRKIWGIISCALYITLKCYIVILFAVNLKISNDLSISSWTAIVLLFWRLIHMIIFITKQAGEAYFVDATSIKLLLYHFRWQFWSGISALLLINLVKLETNQRVVVPRSTGANCWPQLATDKASLTINLSFFSFTISYWAVFQ